MSEEKKKFSLFNIYNRDGKGVEKGTELNVLEKPGFANFFKLFGRRFGEITTINLFYIIGNFPLFFALFALTGYTSTPTVSPASGLYTVLNGSFYYLQNASAGVNSPVLASLNGIYGKQIISSVPTTLTYVLIIISLLFVFTHGLVNVGCTYLYRNMIKGEPLFIWRDFWYAIRRNLKQGIIFGIIDVLISVLLVYDILWFNVNMYAATSMKIFYFMSLGMIVLYFFVRMYIYLLMITFDLSIFKMLKNGLIFTVLGIKRNIACLVGTAIVVAFNFALYVVFIPLGLILPFVITVSVLNYISIYCAFPVIKKYMIDPYYKEIKQQPQEDN